jgi:hypothetical protein
MIYCSRFVRRFFRPEAEKIEQESTGAGEQVKRRENPLGRNQRASASPAVT